MKFSLGRRPAIRGRGSGGWMPQSTGAKVFLCDLATACTCHLSPPHLTSSFLCILLRVLFSQRSELIAFFCLLKTARKRIRTINSSLAMSDQLKELADLPREFLKEGTLFMNRCQKPNKREFTKLCQAVGLGFVVMGAIGYFIRIIHIPVNQILVS